LNNEGYGLIYNILERKNFVSRKAPRIKGATYRGSRLEQIIAANIDLSLIVQSADFPKFNNRTLDRYIVSAHACKIDFIILINKIDLVDEEFLNYWVNLYKKIGYKVYPVSAKNGVGFDEIKEIIKGNVNLVWGPSGVGKSSIINFLFPSVNLKVGEVSNYTSKGKHTTVTSQLLEFENDTYLIDTPGIREIEPFGVSKIDLGHYFDEFKEFIPDCKFNTCTHNHEPGCAVIKAFEEGKISEERYYSYLNILATIEEDVFI